jgi:hypothetical protein
MEYVAKDVEVGGRQRIAEEISANEVDTVLQAVRRDRRDSGLLYWRKVKDRATDTREALA